MNRKLQSFFQWLAPVVLSFALQQAWDHYVKPVKSEILIIQIAHASGQQTPDMCDSQADER